MGQTKGTLMLSKLQESLKRLRNQEGATAVEYGIMVALIAVVIIAAVAFIGDELSSDFSCVGDSLASSGDACNP